MKKNQIISNDAQAVNFREIRMGSIAPGTLFRSSHPIKDNEQETAISMLAGKVRIAAVLNLHDTRSGINSKAFFAPWYNSLFKKDRVIALDMDFNVTGKSFKKKLKDGLKFIINTDGPWLIHCHAGVDRTGFVCMVLESFMGAKLDDVISDYLLSFNSIFESSVYEAQKIDKQVAIQILSVMSEENHAVSLLEKKAVTSSPITDQNLQQIAEIYLQKTIEIGRAHV